MLLAMSNPLRRNTLAITGFEANNDQVRAHNVAAKVGYRAAASHSAAAVAACQVPPAQLTA
ncbi:hypothetical protein A5640_24805 [Mycobacterium asiaticum]|uniref:PE domain-containing protein n=1 Tax=Mycobacterium asiaticum TaxID=1790 RepID=A0A1A3L186_MYCAS|nr:hypothetical protein A5640_24805 [Mycobacterium asiaticum]